MNIILLGLIITLVGTLYLIPTDDAFAEITWEEKPTGTNYKLTNSFFIDKNTGWAISYDGVIMHTSTGGDTWTEQMNVPFSFLKELFFIDKNTGWVVGGSNIYYTTDGVNWKSSVWQTQFNSVPVSLYGVYFTSATEGWVVGNNALILHTTNGGVTWVKQHDGSSYHILTDVDFINSNEGWAVGTNGITLHTTNGGVNWTAIGKISIDIFGVDFIDENIGWVAAKSAVYYTNDGGDTWYHQSSVFGGTVDHIKFLDSNNGWAASGGGGSQGTIFTTSDGGNSWSKHIFDFGGTSSFVFLIDDTFWIVGSDGLTKKGTIITIPPPTIFLPLPTSPSTIVEEKEKNGGCNGDCTPPTLGIDDNGRRLVTNGFSYNGSPKDVELFFTPYPLITINVGEPNTAEFKVYENSGLQNIQHFSLAFGLATGDIISKSLVRIELDINHDGTETVTIHDPENFLDNVSVTTTTSVDCNDYDSDIQCMLITIRHSFNAPPEFNIVATDVWDFKRNAWQNYYNHGIEVVGESLLPPKEYDGINRGHIYHLTETSKGMAVDEFGDTWSYHHGIWNKDYTPSTQPKDGPTNIMTRHHSEFNDYKKIQTQKAIITLLDACPTCLDSYTDWDDSWSHYTPSSVNKLNDPIVQLKMKIENEKATTLMDNLLDPLLYKQE